MSGTLIVIGWILLFLAGLAFLVLLGTPARSRDRTMFWHLWLTTLIAVLEPVGLLLAGVSMWPLVGIYTASLAVMAWRIALLVATRRSAGERAKRTTTIEE